MDYIRLYTAVLTHPKWIVLSKPARAMLVSAWMYAGLQETDGYVPDAARPLIGYSRTADTELEGSWWHRNGAGWDLHDWPEHQESAEELSERRKRLREQWKESKARARKEGRAK